MRGIDIFKRYFEVFDRAFVVIGGTASTLLLDEVGLGFRATKDVDIILIVEALSPEFAEVFWDFVEEGGYENIQQATGKPLFYRFWKPKNRMFPEMVELFSRKPSAIGLHTGSHLTPIPVAEEVASLSAILMDDSYYALARAGVRSVNGLPVLGAGYLIPFKAKAWLDLSRRRKAGEHIDDKDIRKHRNDVFRLYQIVSLEDRIDLPEGIADDLKSFLDAVGSSSLDLSQLDIRGFTLADAIRGLREVYGLI
ncbi:MAG: hypothetical protein ABFD64_10765 [Armatimonadota bacterium]